MPTAPKRYCANCRAIHGTECPKQAARQQERQQQYDEQRGTRTERGYDNQWLRFAKRFLADHPLCDDCMGQGRIEPAVEVHHKSKLKDFPQLKYDQGNLSGLCKSCHRARTARGE